MNECIARASAGPQKCLWLATMKHEYFARYGFHAMSRYRLPISVLFAKLLLVFDQPIARWLPALFGRHTFMRWSPPPPEKDATRA
jgi:hypothetical protein